MVKLRSAPTFRNRICSGWPSCPWIIRLFPETGEGRCPFWKDWPKLIHQHCDMLCMKPTVMCGGLAETLSISVKYELSSPASRPRMAMVAWSEESKSARRDGSGGLGAEGQESPLATLFRGPAFLLKWHLSYTRPADNQLGLDFGEGVLQCRPRPSSQRWYGGAACWDLDVASKRDGPMVRSQIQLGGDDLQKLQ